MVLVKNGHIYEGDSFGNLPWNVEFCESDIFQATEAYLLLQVLKLLTFFFFFDPATCRILVPQPGIEPTLPAVQAGSLNHWSTRKSQNLLHFKSFR